MKLQAYDRISAPPITAEVSVVILRNKFGDIVSVAHELPSGEILIAHCYETGFHKLLQSLGINNTAICEKIKMPAAKTGSKRLIIES